ncbi:MAG: SDR family oxidoreductase [Ferruginibacter sp.]|nr:SDR family oxidoreductase [Ferruginibacter sp.]
MILENQIAIVTGASSGLGFAISSALVQKGAVVFGVARNAEALEEVKQKLGKNFYSVQLNIANRDAVLNWINNTFSNDKHPSILINNAGVGSFGKIDEAPASDWLNMINTNLNGMYFVTSAIVPFMKISTTHSHIINIGSILGTMGRHEGAAYCTTKYGVNGFSDALFKELRSFNIKVTCINPGSIDTGFFNNSGIKSHHNMLQPEDLAKTIIHVLETPDNMLINEITIRPLNPKEPTHMEK